jgi:hypothetical protein
VHEDKTAVQKIAKSSDVVVGGKVSALVALKETMSDGRGG